MYLINVSFRGRELGAIGIAYRITENVFSDNESPTNEFIMSQLNDRYEHFVNIAINSTDELTYDNFSETSYGYELLEEWSSRIIKNSVESEIYEFAMFSLNSDDDNSPINWEDVENYSDEEIFNVFIVESWLAKRLAEHDAMVIDNGWSLFFAHRELSYESVLKRVAYDLRIESFVKYGVK